MNHLTALEDEAISIMRETVATCERPVLLYSIGKDSSCLLHLALKAFYPAKPPLAILHIDTGWKFREMIAFRDRKMAEFGLECLVHTNVEAQRAGITPFSHPGTYTDIMKTQALREALDLYGFDAAIGGARRDEERSRAKERVFSFRAAGHRWDPKGQRPEPWQLFNTEKKPGESFRVFPLSNWCERDVWDYIRQENIEVVPLYFAKVRPVVQHNGALILVDDNRMPLASPVEQRSVRFRTLGCYPLTGAVESCAADLDSVIEEMLASRVSERGQRLIDGEGVASMERKKQEGYF